MPRHHLFSDYISWCRILKDKILYPHDGFLWINSHNVSQLEVQKPLVILQGIFLIIQEKLNQLMKFLEHLILEEKRLKIDI